jgi:hypothetical protein
LARLSPLSMEPPRLSRLSMGLSASLYLSCIMHPLTLVSEKNDLAAT